MGVVALEELAVGARQADALTVLRAVLEDATRLMQFGPGHQGQIQGAGYGRGGQDGPLHQAGVQMGNGESALVEDVPGIGLSLRIDPSQQLGQMLGLLPADLRQQRIWVATGRGAGLGPQGVVF